MCLVPQLRKKIQSRLHNVDVVWAARKSGWSGRLPTRVLKWHVSVSKLEDNVAVGYLTLNGAFIPFVSFVAQGLGGLSSPGATLSLCSRGLAQASSACSRPWLGVVSRLSKVCFFIIGLCRMSFIYVLSFLRAGLTSFIWLSAWSSWRMRAAWRLLSAWRYLDTIYLCFLE